MVYSVNSWEHYCRNRPIFVLRLTIRKESLVIKWHGVLQKGADLFIIELDCFTPKNVLFTPAPAGYIVFPDHWQATDFDCVIAGAEL